MTRAVSVAYALEEPSGVRAISAQVAVPRRLTIGHLSNLTVDKGLGEVIRFGRAALARGQVERVILAGPAMGDVEQALIRAVLAEPGFEYWGFVAGQRREAFFMDIDLFLFPSRYKNESYGLVAWEAMLRGVPVIAYRAGCLTQAAAGPSNTILEPSEDFTATALSRVEELCGSSARLAEDSAAVATVAREERARARSDVIQLGIELFGLTGARTLN
jgi:glycosyltransferase involved in cell wall biosynthesis